MKSIYLILSLFVTQFIFSQTGIIKGTTVEEATGKTIPGISVKIQNTKYLTISDADGNFIFRNIPVGKYDLEFTSLSFDGKIISEVEVIANETASLNVSLAEKNTKLEEVQIKVTKNKTESIKSLLTMQKNSIRVSDGISAETIKRTPDRTTSDVLKRISGASIQDNRFVIIRGLNDRYNTSYLNGAPLPSSEPDRKAFSFDIFPANMIDNLVIYKTASPDLPGEFAGGVIEINTKAVPDKNFQSISIGSGYNTVTTGKDQQYYKGGNTDWLGIDDGSRSLSPNVPSSQDMQALQSVRNDLNQEALINISKNYQTDWNSYNKDFAPNTNFQYTLGRYFKVKEESHLGFLFSVTHSTSNSYEETALKTFASPGVLEIDQLSKNYLQRVLLGGIANISFKLNPNNNFTFKNLYSINTENGFLDRDGALNQDPDKLQAKTTARQFTANNIYSSQLIGEHYLPDTKLKINWNVAYNNVQRTIPSERRNTYNYFKFEDGSTSPLSTLFLTNTVSPESAGVIFSSKNAEDVYFGKIDLNRKFKITDDFATDFKIGGLFQRRNRDFESRLLGYTAFNGAFNGVNYGTDTYDGSIGLQPNATIFNANNMGVLGPNRSGLVLFDATRPNDAYDATSKLNVGYVMFDHSYKKFRLVWGFRIEDFNQKLNAFTDAGKAILVNQTQTDILPSLNLIYGLTKTQNLRFSVSRTLNRPEFRELAPFVFYDVATRFNTEGNPDLKIATIDNYDLRYEIFPGKGQLFSASLFYKRFQDPIEIQAKANNTNRYENAKSGVNQGIELEYRTLLGSIVGNDVNKFLNDMTLYTNLAIIKSRVDISNLIQSSTLEDIPLQGQSPYVFNAGLQYINKDYGWGSSLNVNRVGNRILFQANQTVNTNVPALWEKSRTFLDLQITKSFLKNKIEAKLNIQNILAQNLVIYQNNDKNPENLKGLNGFINNVFTGSASNPNSYNPDVDDTIFLTKLGRTFSFSVSYSF
jgi:outer membrane receptor protein involved in Fe transport